MSLSNKHEWKINATLATAVLDGAADLPMTARMTLLQLCRFANTKGECFPSQDEIARRSGVTPRSVRRALDILREKDYVRVTLRGRTTAMTRLNVEKLLRISAAPPAQPRPPESPAEGSLAEPNPADQSSLIRWLAALEYIRERKTLREELVSTWLESCTLASDRRTIICPNTFFAETIKRNILEPVAIALGLDEGDVKFAVDYEYYEA
ncbi:hypothetical protein BH09SUM1_BH09SUM1_26320 [soil metagenome]